MAKQATTHSEQDKELWKLLMDVPRLNGVWPYVCAIINFVWSGLGTIIAGCMCEGSWSKAQITVGFLQMMLSVYLVGWFWSIYWGYLLVMKANKDKKEVQQFLADTAVRSDA